MKTLLLILAALCMVACSGVRVLDTDRAEGFQLSQYKTFCFYSLETTSIDTTTIAYRQNVEALKAAIARQLEAKGLKQDANPDLLVNIGVKVEEKVQTRETDFRDAPRYVGQRSYSWKSEEVEVGRYKEGTVTVHLVDKAQNKMVWKGATAGVIPNNKSKIPATIDEGMTALFAKL